MIAALAFVIASATSWDVRVTADRSMALSSISESRMRGNLSFLASDLLEGRATPSPGLDIAATFIASQFRAAGLKPLGDDDFFQTTTYREARVRNVIGLLEGSDPTLKNQYIFVTAHYDHLGKKSSGEGDLIFNGACDDGSGTVSVIEIAHALSQMKVKPKRSIVFLTFWGEERGLLGSRYYGKNPIIPIRKTIADVNIEQVGRTDDSEGPRVNAVSITGEDYSDVGKVFKMAGKQLKTGVEKHPHLSDWYFGASDNQALADLGVPAHTVCTAFQFPDYHRVGDEWQKIDYANMVKVNKLIALSVLALADSQSEPEWSKDNPKAAKYRKAKADRIASNG